MSIFEYDEERHKKTIYEEAFEDGEKKGEAIGYTKGESAGKIITARNMKREGISESIICKVTGLSMEEIEKTICV